MDGSKELAPQDPGGGGCKEDVTWAAPEVPGWGPGPGLSLLFGFQNVPPLSLFPPQRAVGIRAGR